MLVTKLLNNINICYEFVDLISSMSICICTLYREHLHLAVQEFLCESLIRISNYKLDI